VHVSIGRGALKQVKADLKDLQADLSALMGDVHGAFSVQINALRSALTRSVDSSLEFGPLLAMGR
jgi:hypothetical protein